MRNLKMTIEYDGSNYFGWQRQSGFITIQEILEEAIRKITQEKVTVNGSSRTDAGVHAINQVANFRTKSRIPEWNLLMGLNSLLPEDIGVKTLVETEEGFHSRYDAKGKVYHYKILNCPVRAPLLRNYSWFIYKPLNVENMTAAASKLIGTHDFSAFCASGCDVKNHIRNVVEARFKRDGDIMIVFTIEADGFLRHMVRNIVGTLVDVGMGNRPPSEVSWILKSGDRKNAGVTAPPQGLFLAEVRY
jgi:tRNA pseudouridine38-40 synthase